MVIVTVSFWVLSKQSLPAWFLPICRPLGGEGAGCMEKPIDPQITIAQLSPFNPLGQAPEREWPEGLLIKTKSHPGFGLGFRWNEDLMCSRKWSFYFSNCKPLVELIGRLQQYAQEASLSGKLESCEWGQCPRAADQREGRKKGPEVPQSPKASKSS